MVYSYSCQYTCTLWIELCAQVLIHPYTPVLRPPSETHSLCMHAEGLGMKLIQYLLLGKACVVGRSKGITRRCVLDLFVRCLMFVASQSHTVYGAVDTGMSKYILDVYCCRYSV